jgi:hypothetical protein
MPGREVTLVLCTAGGDLLGAAAPFCVASEWWRDVEDIVTAARAISSRGPRPDTGP